MTLIVLMYALFGASVSMGKALLAYTTPLFLIGSRMCIGGGILLTYTYITQKATFNVQRKDWIHFIEVTILGIYLTYIMRVWALQYLPSFKTCFLYNLSPFMASFYSYFMLNEKMTFHQWIGLGIGFLGMIPILLSSTPAEASMGEFMNISWPELLVIASVATHSYSWIIVRKLVKFKKYSPLMVNSVTMSLGGILAITTSFFYDGFFPVKNVQKFSILLAAIILISNIICHNIYGHLLKKYTATFIAFTGFLAPLFSALYGWAFLNEVITWHFYVSTLIVLVGLGIFYKDELLQQKQVESIIETE